MINATWNSEAALKDPSAITPASVAILNKAALKQCDRLDGVERWRHLRSAPLQLRSRDPPMQGKRGRR